MSVTPNYLEFSLKKADHKESNSNYHVNLSQEIRIDQGDQVGLFLASIDSQQADSDSIVIPEDTIVSMSFNYYDVDYSKANKLQYGTSTPWLNATYVPYAGYVSRSIYKLNYAAFYCWDYIGPTPVSLGQEVIIDVEFRYINTDGKLAYTTYRGNTFKPVPGAPVPYNPPYAYPYPGLTGAPTIYFQEGTLQVNQITATLVTVGGETPGDPNHVTNHPELYSQVKSADGAKQLDIRTVTTTIKAGRYDRVSMGRLLTKQLAYCNGIEPPYSGAVNQHYMPNNQLLIRTDDIAGGEIIFRQIDNTLAGQPFNFTTANSYTYAPGSTVACGACLFSIVYGNEGSSIFEISAAHTPLYNPASPSVQNVGIFYTGSAPTNDLRYYLVTTATGIAITDLQPRDFWFDKLGFDSSVLVNIQTAQDGTNFYQLNDFNGKITEGYASVAAFMPTYNRVITDPTPPAANPTYLAVDGQTISLLGKQIRAEQSGYLLLQINDMGFSPSNYLTERYGVGNIMGVISTEYTNNDIISGFTDSALTYTHVGRSVLLKEGTVRILDPNTMEERDGLGDNTIVVLYVIKSPQQALPAPPVPPPKTLIRKIK